MIVMRRLVFSVLLIALAFAYGAAKEETVAELKARFESARAEDRPELGMQIAQRQLRNADQLYRNDNAGEAALAVEDVVTYCEKAGDAATRTGKRLKDLEIHVRKMAEKLRDIKRTLAYADQPPVEQAIRHLEDVRTALLKAMFAKNKKEKR